MPKLPFGKRNDDQIPSVQGDTDEEEGSGKGIFGDGVNDPIYSLEASRIKGGRLFSPNVIAVWPDRIEEHEVHAIRKSGTQAIHFRQVAQVAFERGIFYTNITVESSGGHVIRMKGIPGDDGFKIKSIIDDAVKAAHEQKPTTPTQTAPPMDIADQLTKLAALRDSGVLTAEEFQTQKERILGL